jgi:hypothetical protein
VDAAKVAQIESVEEIYDFFRVGQKFAGRSSLNSFPEQFGHFEEV